MTTIGKEIAEILDISRQAVAKWEARLSYKRAGL